MDAKEKRRLYMREYSRTERNREYRRKYNQRPEIRAKRLAGQRGKYRDHKNSHNRAYMKEYNEKIVRVEYEIGRKLIKDLLGGKCAGCGETDHEVLQLDHVNDDGASHRKLGFKVGNRNDLLRVVEEIVAGSDRYQLLCANCNWRKELKRRKVGEYN
jgi:hypothetical protein